MADQNLASNPFAALFPSLSDAQQFTANYKAELQQSGMKYSGPQWPLQYKICTDTFTL